MGSYELRDVDHHALGQIYEGKLVLDKTWGHGYYGCANCCGDGNFTFAPGLMSNPVGIGGGDEIDATNTCSAMIDDFTYDAYNWFSTNTAAATVQNAWTQLVGVGTGRGSGSVDYIKNDKYHQCPTATATPSGNIQSDPDQTPVISGIDPVIWPAGSTTSVTFTGQNFGTNAPTLGFDPSSGISYSLTSYNDSQIVASINVDSATPNEDVTVTVTNNGYGGFSFGPGATGNSPTSGSAEASVRNTPTGTPEITVIGWVDGNATDILNTVSAGPSTPQLASDLSSSVYCWTTLRSWSRGTKTDIVTAQDVSYANAWLMNHSGNSAPPTTTIVPSQQQSAGNFRLFNDYGGGSNGHPQTGTTPVPCTSGIPSWWLTNSAGQDSPYAGSSSISPAGEDYLLSEGRIGTAGQAINQTLNGTTTPWIWSVIEFDPSGNPTYSDLSMFPTFSIYRNGVFQTTIPQGALANFIQKDSTYQRKPSDIQ